MPRTLAVFLAPPSSEATAIWSVDDLAIAMLGSLSSTGFNTLTCTSPGDVTVTVVAGKVGTTCATLLSFTITCDP